jgi:hypothetical protein
MTYEVWYDQISDKLILVSGYDYYFRDYVLDEDYFYVGVL